MISASSKKETTNTGVYTIDPDGSVASNVFFDQTTAGPVRWRGGGGGRCFRRDWMARLISTVAWPIARMGLVTWTENFGWDWTGFTVWQQWKTSSVRILQPSSETLRLYFPTYFPVRGLSTSSVLENTQVITVEKIEKKKIKSHSKIWLPLFLADIKVIWD